MNLLERHPRQDSGCAELAGMLEQLGRGGEALAVIESGLAAGCGSAALRDTAYAAFRAASDSKQMPQALALLECAAALDETHVVIQCELAGQYRASGRWHDAEAKYRHVLSLAPEHLSALGGLAIVRRQFGDTETALALLTQAQSVDAANEWIRFELALTWRDRGRLDDAGALLELIEPGPGIYVWARMTLGHMARARQEHRWAAAYFGQAARHAPDPVDALCQIAAEYRALGDFAAAQLALARAFAQAPGSWQVLMAQGYLHRATADTAAAREAFHRAAEAAPAQAQPLVELAAEESDLGNHAAAAACIEAALRIDGRHEGALLKRAAWLGENGDDTAALEVYQQLRDARPASVWGYFGAAQILCERGQAEAALALLNEAARTCPVNAQIDMRRAGILRQIGLLDEAYTVLSATQARFALELTPWCHLVSAAIDLGRFGVADALLEAPPPAAGRAAARIEMLRAQLFKARWCLEPAMAAFGDAIALDSVDTQAVYERAKLRLITFDLDGARADLLAHSEKRRLASRRDGRSANPSQTHVGQLYDEFALESGLAPALRAAQALVAGEQIAALAGLARQFPESTAAAIGFMIGLRRAGMLDVRPAATALSALPRSISQYWNDAAPPPDVHALMQSWPSAEPDYEIEIFNDATALAYLRARFGAAVARAFAMAAEPAQRADIFRLARLYREGGFYIDADDRARDGLSPHVPASATLFVHQEDLGSAGNNIIGASPGHPVIAAALRGAVHAVLRGDRDIVWLSTGPGLLTRALAQWLAAAPAELDARLAATSVLTLAEMRQVTAMHCHAAYKTTPRAWLNSAFPQRKRA